MKHTNHKKGLLVAVLMVLLLTSAVSGTIAYLIAKTDEVENTFTPAQVDTEIKEEFEDANKTVKKFIGVENPMNEESIDAYVRVAVVGNWCNDAGEIVKPWTPDFTYNDKDWFKCDDYYYYRTELEVNTTTNNLLASNETIAETSSDTDYDGLHLVVTVMQQAIQSQPDDAVESIWPVDANNGTIIAK